MTVEDSHDLGMVLAHTVEQNAAGVALGCRGIDAAMGGNDGAGTGVCIQNGVDPGNLVGVDVPAYTDEENLLTVHFYNIIVPKIVFVGPAVVGLVLVVFLSEILPVEIVHHVAVGHIVVATQNAGGDPGIFQPLLLRTCESELILLVELIGNVAGMEDIFDIQVILFVDDPAHHILIVLVIPLGIVLSVRIPGDGEVIVLRNRCTVPIIVVPDLGVKIICLGIGGIGDGAGLDQDADSAVSDGRRRHQSRERIAIPVHIQQLPCVVPEHIKLNVFAVVICHSQLHTDVLFLSADRDLQDLIGVLTVIRYSSAGAGLGRSLSGAIPRTLQDVEVLNALCLPHGHASCTLHSGHLGLGAVEGQGNGQVHGFFLHPHRLRILNLKGDVLHLVACSHGQGMNAIGQGGGVQRKCLGIHISCRDGEGHLHIDVLVGRVADLDGAGGIKGYDIPCGDVLAHTGIGCQNRPVPQNQPQVGSHKVLVVLVRIGFPAGAVGGGTQGQFNGRAALTIVLEVLLSHRHGQTTVSGDGAALGEGANDGAGRLRITAGGQAVFEVAVHSGVVKDEVGATLHGSGRVQRLTVQGKGGSGCTAIILSRDLNGAGIGFAAHVCAVEVHAQPGLFPVVVDLHSDWLSLGIAVGVVEPDIVFHPVSSLKIAVLNKGVPLVVDGKGGSLEHLVAVHFVRLPAELGRGHGQSLRAGVGIGDAEAFTLLQPLLQDLQRLSIIGAGGKFHGRSGVVIGYERDLAICHHAHIGAALGGVDLHQRTLYGNLQVHALVVLQIADAIPEVAGNQGFGVALTLLIQVKAPQGIAQTVLGGEDVDGHLVRDGVGGTEFRQGWESLIICPLG